MRKLLIASAVALGASFGPGVAANAAGVTVQLNTGHGRHDAVRVYRHHRHHRHCMTKTVITYHHHRKIVKHERVCR